jgi:hypothetical protein
LRNPSIHERQLMDIAEFIIGLAEGRTRWPQPSYVLSDTERAMLMGGACAMAYG